MESVWLVALVGFLLGTLVGSGLRPVWRWYVRGQPVGSSHAPSFTSASASSEAESVPSGDTVARGSERDEPCSDESRAGGESTTTAFVLSTRSDSSGTRSTEAVDPVMSLPAPLRDPLMLLCHTFRYDDIGAVFGGNEQPYIFRMVSDFMELEIPRHAQVLAMPTDQFRDDAVYAFRLGDTFYIARVMRLPDWRLRVLPANDAYCPFTLSLRTADIAVLGRVFAITI